MTDSMNSHRIHTVSLSVKFEIRIHILLKWTFKKKDVQNSGISKNLLQKMMITIMWRCRLRNISRARMGPGYNVFCKVCVRFKWSLGAHTILLTPYLHTINTCQRIISILQLVIIM